MPLLQRFGIGCLALAALAAASAPACAEVRAVGRYKDWRVFTESQGKDLVCFAAVEASDKAPKNIDHGDVNFYVSTWKSGRSAEQPSLKVGYTLRGDIAPEAIIDRQRFRMYAVGVEAFVADALERSLLNALKKGSELRIEAASTDDARTAYYFSLKGSREAIEKARALCK